MKEKLYSITTKNACFGMVTVDDTVTETAPIGKRYLGHNIEHVKRDIKKFNGTIKLVKIIKEQKGLF